MMNAAAATFNQIPKIVTHNTKSTIRNKSRNVVVIPRRKVQNVKMASMINPFPDLITLSYPELISWIIPSTVFLRLMNVKNTDIYKILFTISVFRVMCVMHDLLN